MSSMQPARRATTILVCTLLLMALVTSAALSLPTRTAYAAPVISVSGATRYQTIDGFGFSGAFGPAQELEQTPSSMQRQILDLLFSTSSGAGFSILRNLLPSDQAHTIEPSSPGSPNAIPTYVWDHDSWGQVWLSKQAQSYGVTQFYGDAWSAPGFMKTNGSEANGGSLCGSPGASCSSGDWRQAYANYLLQYYRDYLSDGIRLTQIGAFNEPNLSTYYSSMVMNPTQTADFVAILGPTLRAAGVTAQVVCCDGEGWDSAQSYANGILANPSANSYLDLFSSHGYTAPPTTPITGLGSRHVWQTEWAKFDSADYSWDDGGDGSGFYWAQQIYTGLTAANLNAFFYWWGVNFNASDNGYLINVVNGTVMPAKRLWSFANYSRFVRPGATRIGATSSDSSLEVTAFLNTNGTLAIVVLNTSYSAMPVTLSLQGLALPANASAVPYVTDASHNTEAQTPLSIQNNSFSATIAARQLVTYVIAGGSAATPTPLPSPTAAPTAIPTTTPTVAPSPTPTSSPTPGAGATCSIHYVVNAQWPGGFSASLQIANAGTTPINGWQLQFTFANGQTVTQGWNGSFSQSGSTVTVTNLSYNANIPPGSVLGASPGFNGTWNGSNNPPTAFRLNGVNCTII
ncbi:cellulose binding domain-containing protein [Thermogemmatispora sp.]|uniref:cellulose binding domain-containing protein n=1 Tax=Thermogemmatispora sp. TaxID=1968838 RepID=UPI001D86B2E8|nr:cellulose binding domain-containing protein [Thermogemmatispora sp.]MBX5451015.1 cellulose binding domain-containing protein [Thermogemmatispora sp.]